MLDQLSLYLTMTGVRHWRDGGRMGGRGWQLWPDRPGMWLLTTAIPNAHGRVHSTCCSLPDVAYALEPVLCAKS